MRVLIFHGYLLRGTGSNVYNAELGQALVRAGHELHMLCQDRAPLELPWVDAAGDWDGGELRLTVRRDPPRATVYRPDLGGLLPVYVADRYEGVEARPYEELSEAEVEAYVARNVAAVAEVIERARPDVALANHLVMGPLILARAGLSVCGQDPRQRAGVHGQAPSALHAGRPRGPGGRARGPGRLAPHGGEPLGGAGRPGPAGPHPPRPARRRRHPLRPARAGRGRRGPGEAARGARGRGGRRARGRRPRLVAGAASAAARGSSPEPTSAAAPARRRGRPRPPPARRRGRPRRPAGSSFDRSAAEAAAALGAVDPRRDRIVAYVGKLIASKGVELLLAAWPLVLARAPDARLLIVGFGAFRGALEGLAAALARGDLEEARALRAEDGRELPELGAFLDALGPDADAYRAAAAGLEGSVHWAGRLEHPELTDVLPAATALAMPSTFPEAFGMVAAEAAACGALPVVAGHSGMAEVARALAAAVPPEVRPWLTFEVGPHSVTQLGEALASWLEAPAELRAATRDAIVGVARERYSWDGVARTMIAAAEGRVDELPSP